MAVNETLYIRDWFASKIEAEAPWFCVGWSLTVTPDQIRKETEKAYQVYFNGVTPKQNKPSGFACWVPKKVMETREQMEARVKAEEEHRAKRFEEGKKRHEALIQLAKDNGIRGVRKNLRTDTLLEMLARAGVEVKF